MNQMLDTDYSSAGDGRRRRNLPTTVAATQAVAGVGSDSVKEVCDGTPPIDRMGGVGVFQSSNGVLVE